MELGRAWRVLGMDPCDDPGELRAGFARRLFDLHPDHSDAPDATAATIELNEAYQVVVTHLGAATHAPPSSANGSADPSSAPPSAPRATAPRADDPREVVAIAQLDDDTIGIGAPGPETYRVLLEAAHRLGEVIYVEPSSGLIQVMVEFVDGPICQLLLTLQGRATGVTEAFLTIESLDDEPPPPIDAVTRLYIDTLTTG